MEKGLLHRVQPGVYAFGTELSPRGQRRAALLTCGEPAWLAARTACVEWGFLDEWNGPIDILLRCRHLVRTGLNVRTTRWLPDEHRTVRDGLPVTTPGRSLLDAAPLLDALVLERAVAAALRSRWVTMDAMAALASSGRPGAPAIGVQLRRLGGPQFSRSKAERIVLGLCRDARLPPPQLNRELFGRERDLIWHDARLVVEFDGDEFHWSPAAKRADQARDAALELRGWRTLRLTWHELTEEPMVVVAKIAAALARQYAGQRYA